MRFLKRNLIDLVILAAVICAIIVGAGPCFAQCSGGSCPASSRGQSVQSYSSSCATGQCGASATHSFAPGSVVHCTDGTWLQIQANGSGVACRAPKPYIAQSMDAPLKVDCPTCPLCGCGCDKSGLCLCQSCNKHTADPASPDYVPPVKKISAVPEMTPIDGLTKIAPKEGYAFYRDSELNIYHLKESVADAMIAANKANGEPVMIKAEYSWVRNK